MLGKMLIGSYNNGHAESYDEVAACMPGENDFATKTIKAAKSPPIEKRTK